MTTETSLSNASGQDTTNAGNTTQQADGVKPDDQGNGAPTDAQAPANADAAKPDDKGAQVPEKYDFAMPEGVAIDSAAADEFSTIAKDLKLSQADAQKVADVGAKMAQRQQEQHAQKVQTWVESVKTDKEIGGDKLDENLAVARNAIKTYGTPELKEILDGTGLGNHPAFVKAFYKIGLTLKTDDVFRGGTTTGEADPAKKMFPNMN